MLWADSLLKTGRIEYIQSEHTEDKFYDSRGIRMDVYVKGSDKIYDVELQNGHYTDLLLRTRYYQAVSDIGSTSRRTKFRDRRCL